MRRLKLKYKLIRQKVSAKNPELEILSISPISFSNNERLKSFLNSRFDLGEGVFRYAATFPRIEREVLTILTNNLYTVVSKPGEIKIEELDAMAQIKEELHRRIKSIFITLDTASDNFEAISQSKRWLKKLEQSLVVDGEFEYEEEKKESKKMSFDDGLFKEDKDKKKVLEFLQEHSLIGEFHEHRLKKRGDSLIGKGAFYGVYRGAHSKRLINVHDEKKGWEIFYKYFFGEPHCRTETSKQATKYYNLFCKYVCPDSHEDNELPDKKM